ncbi:hypothetical protein Tco_0827546 [Tanacetum coccineum]
MAWFRRKAFPSVLITNWAVDRVKMDSMFVKVSSSSKSSICDRPRKNFNLEGEEFIPSGGIRELLRFKRRIEDIETPEKQKNLMKALQLLKKKEKIKTIIKTTKEDKNKKKEEKKNKKNTEVRWCDGGGRD